MTKKDKNKSRNINILDKVVELLLYDAVIAFPRSSVDPYDVGEWVKWTKLSIMEAVKRQHVSSQPKYKDLSPEEKGLNILKMAKEKVDFIRDKTEQQALADSYLEMKAPPLRPLESDEHSSEISSDSLESDQSKD